jgi:hypothetical protein
MQIAYELNGGHSTTGPRTTIFGSPGVSTNKSLEIPPLLLGHSTSIEFYVPSVRSKNAFWPSISKYSRRTYILVLYHAGQE